MQIHVVLIRTLYEQNVGSAARACANMGAKNLILVDSKLTIGTKAYQAAANGQMFLDQLHRYQSWEELKKFTAEGLWIATTARGGKGRLILPIKEVAKRILQMTVPENIYLVFGPEDAGLTNEDLDQCHFAGFIPTYGPIQSLNVSQAVLLSLYTLNDMLETECNIPDGYRSEKLADNQTIDLADRNLSSLIRNLGFSIDNKSINAYSVLRKCFLESMPTQKEAELFANVSAQISRKISEYNKSRLI
jgi:tRNA/rRNA methyltransferase